MTTTETFNAWVTCPRPNPKATLRLFCFHYAGGAAWIFRPWLNHLPITVEVCPIELPGRGKRMAEPPLTRLEPLIQTLMSAILPNLNKPFAFFGHSMGGLLSFELSCLLRKEYGISPVHLFVSGCRAPQIPAPHSPIHELPESEFLEELRRFNGTPESVIENAELMKLLLPTLRADFAVLETYVYTPELPLNCPITVFGGLQDSEVSYEHLDAWRMQTNGAFSLEMFEGDHFFIDSARSLLLESLSEHLRQNMSSQMGSEPRYV
jgi:medium-chain acyl-[acyl-carrier-protein] hydrolase